MLYNTSGAEMMIQTTYTKARANLARLMDRVTKDRDVVIVRRRGAEDVAMIAADELEAIFESVHLIRSPKNAERLLTALRRALQDEIPPTDLETLYQEIDFAPEST